MNSTKRRHHGSGGKRRTSKASSRRKRTRELLFEVIEERCLLSANPLVLLAPDASYDTALVADVSAQGVGRLAVRIRSEPVQAWQNPEIGLDANGDGRVTPLDALALINSLNARSAGPLPGTTEASFNGTPFPDVNGDGLLTPQDVLPVVSWLDYPMLLAVNATFQTTENAGAVLLDVLPNDRLPPGATAITAISAIGSSRAHATIEIWDGIKLIYTPPIGFVGADTFTYEIVDNGRAWQNGVMVDDLKTATGTVSVTVTPASGAPVLSGVPTNATITEESPFTFTAKATDPDLPWQTLTFSLADFDASNKVPVGATIGAGSGVFTWTPSEAQGPGTYKFSVAVSDGVTSVLKTVVLTVGEVNSAPVLTGVPASTTIPELATATFTISATDSDLPVNTLTATAAGLPPGATFDPAARQFTWTPSEAQGPGSYPVTFNVSDNGTPPLSDTQTVTITVDEVNQPPVLTGVPASTTIPELASYSFTVVATDADLPAQALTYSLADFDASNKVPAGAAIGSSTGVFTWTPTEVQGPSTFKFYVSVSDGSVTVTRLMQITVVRAPSVGGRVWRDVNGNGLQDPGEPGFAGAVAELFSSTDDVIGNGDDTSHGAAIADGTGHYIFCQLRPDVAYYLMFRAPPAYRFTTPRVGGDKSLDSNAEGSGATVLFTVPLGQETFVLDAGLAGAGPDFGFALAVSGARNEYGLAVASDVAGNAYVTGRTEGTVDFDPGPGTYYLTGDGTFVAKYTSAGALVWAREFGGASRGQGIALGPDGSVYAIGFFNSLADFDPGPGTFTLTNAGVFDVFVLKLDAAGDFLWAKSFGGSGCEEGWGLAVGPDGSVYTTGYFSGTTDFDPGPMTYTLTSAGGSNDVFLSKLDANGNFLWSRAFGGSDADWGYRVAVSTDGNVYTTGYFSGTTDFDPGAATYTLTSAGDNDTFVTKLGANGNFLWARALGGPGTDKGMGLAIAADGSVFVSGGFSSTADFDPGPGTQWLTSAGGYDGFVCKLDAAGNYIWVRQLGSAQDDVVRGVGLETDGTVYGTGAFEDTADMDPGEGLYNLTSDGDYDGFVAELDKNGNFLGARAFGGTSLDASFDLAIAPDGSVYTTGYFSTPASFGPPTSGSQLGGGSGLDMYLAKFTQHYLTYLPPVLSNVPASVTIPELAAYSFTATATDADLPAQALTYSLADFDASNKVPAGAAIGSSTGVFTWTPTEVQGPSTFKFYVSVSDGVTSVLKTVVLTVGEVNVGPVAPFVADQTTYEGHEYGFVIPPFTDEEDGSLRPNSIQVVDGSPLPAWLNFDPLTGCLFGTPIESDIGTVTFLVGAADSLSASTTVAFTLTVITDPVRVAVSDLTAAANAQLSAPEVEDPVQHDTIADTQASIDERTRVLNERLAAVDALQSRLRAFDQGTLTTEQAGTLATLTSRLDEYGKQLSKQASKAFAVSPIDIAARLATDPTKPLFDVDVGTQIYRVVRTNQGDSLFVSGHRTTVVGLNTTSLTAGRLDEIDRIESDGNGLVVALRTSESGSTVFSGGYYGYNFVVRNSVTGDLQIPIVHFDAFVTDIAVELGEQTALVEVYGHPVQRVDLSTGAVSDAFASFGSPWSMRLSDDKTKLVLASPDKLAIYDAFTELPIRSLTAPQYPLYYAEISPEGQYLAGVDEHNTLHVWDVSSGEEVASGNVGQWRLGLAFLTDSVIITNSNSGLTRWTISGRQLSSEIICYGSVESVALSPRKEALIIGSGTRLKAYPSGFIADSHLRPLADNVDFAASREIHDIFIGLTEQSAFASPLLPPPQPSDAQSNVDYITQKSQELATRRKALEDFEMRISAVEASGCSQATKNRLPPLRSSLESLKAETKIAEDALKLWRFRVSDLATTGDVFARAGYTRLTPDGDDLQSRSDWIVQGIAQLTTPWNLDGQQNRLARLTQRGDDLGIVGQTAAALVDEIIDSQPGMEVNPQTLTLLRAEAVEAASNVSRSIKEWATLAANPENRTTTFTYDINPLDALSIPRFLVALSQQDFTNTLSVRIRSPLDQTYIEIQDDTGDYQDHNTIQDIVQHPGGTSDTTWVTSFVRRGNGSGGEFVVRMYDSPQKTMLLGQVSGFYSPAANAGSVETQPPWEALNPKVPLSLPDEIGGSAILQIWQGRVGNPVSQRLTDNSFVSGSGAFTLDLASADHLVTAVQFSVASEKLDDLVTAYFYRGNTLVGTEAVPSDTVATFSDEAGITSVIVPNTMKPMSDLARAFLAYFHSADGQSEVGRSAWEWWKQEGYKSFPQFGGASVAFFADPNRRVIPDQEKWRILQEAADGPTSYALHLSDIHVTADVSQRQVSADVLSIATNAGLSYMMHPDWYQTGETLFRGGTAGYLAVGRFAPNAVGIRRPDLQQYSVVRLIGRDAGVKITAVNYHTAGGDAPLPSGYCEVNGSFVILRPGAPEQIVLYFSGLYGQEPEAVTVDISQSQSATLEDILPPEKMTVSTNILAFRGKNENEWVRPMLTEIAPQAPADK